MAQGYGTSEEIISDWLAQDASRRDRIVLATKAYQPMETGPNDKYPSAYHFRRACEASLKRLKTDHIDRATPRVVPHGRAVAAEPEGAIGQALGRGAGQAGRNLARTERRGAAGLCLVAPNP